MLLERVKVPLPKVLDRMGTLQAQYAPSMYIGLWTRMDGFERDQLDRALERRSVAQGTLMRSTIHLVSKADYWPAAIGIRRGRRESWLKYGPRRDYTAAQMSAHARKLRAALGDGTMSRKEIHELLGKDSIVTNGVNAWLDLVRAPPSGTWERRRADLYAAAEQWLGPPPEIDETDGKERLVRRYLGAFGPSTAAEIADWAGLQPKSLGQAIERIKLRRFTAEDGAELLDLPRAPLPDADTPVPVRLLPTWDATLLVHARRTQILPEEHRPKVFHTKTPQSVPTFLVDGAVAGTWRHERGRVELRPLVKLGRADREQLDEEGHRLAAFHV